MRGDGMPLKTVDLRVPRDAVLRMSTPLRAALGDVKIEGYSVVGSLSSEGTERVWLKARNLEVARFLLRFVTDMAKLYRTDMLRLRSRRPSFNGFERTGEPPRLARDLCFPDQCDMNAPLNWAPLCTTEASIPALILLPTC